MDNCNIILCHSQASIHFKQSNSPSEQAHSDKGSQAFRVGVVGAQRLEVYGIGFLVVLLCQPLVASFTMNNYDILFWWLQQTHELLRGILSRYPALSARFRSCLAEKTRFQCSSPWLQRSHMRRAEGCFENWERRVVLKKSLVVVAQPLVHVCNVHTSAGAAHMSSAKRFCLDVQAVQRLMKQI